MSTSISSKLVALDHFLDRIPLISLMSNGLELILKSLFIPIISKFGPKSLTESHAFQHLKEKENWRIVLNALPGGVLAVEFVDRVNKKTLLSIDNDLPAIDLLAKASYTQRDDKEIILAWVTKTPEAFKLASVRLQNDPEIVDAYIKHRASVSHLTPDQKNDYGLMYRAISNYPQNERYVGEQLKQNPQFIQDIITLHPEFLDDDTFLEAQDHIWLTSSFIEHVVKNGDSKLLPKLSARIERKGTALILDPSLLTFAYNKLDKNAIAKLLKLVDKSCKKVLIDQEDVLKNSLVPLNKDYFLTLFTGLKESLSPYPHLLNFLSKQLLEIYNSKLKQDPQFVFEMISHHPELLDDRDFLGSELLWLTQPLLKLALEKGSEQVVAKLLDRVKRNPALLRANPLFDTNLFLFAISKVDKKSDNWLRLFDLIDKKCEQKTLINNLDKEFFLRFCLDLEGFDFSPYPHFQRFIYSKLLTLIKSKKSDGIAIKVLIRQTLEVTGKIKGNPDFRALEAFAKR